MTTITLPTKGDRHIKASFDYGKPTSSRIEIPNSAILFLPVCSDHSAPAITNRLRDLASRSHNTES